MHPSEYRTVGSSRFTIIIAIGGIMLSAVTLMIFSFLVVLKTIWDTIDHGDLDVETAKHLAIVFMEMTDLFLFAMVLEVVVVGLYQLFINPGVRVPEWMRVGSLSDLKSQLVDVIVVLLAVTFLTVAVSWADERSIIYLGGSTAVVVFSLAAYQYVHHRTKHE